MWTSLCTNLCYPVEIKDIIIIIILLPVKFHWILFSGFRREVEYVKS